MTSLALALALAAQQPAPQARPLRIVATSTLHVGLRPAAYLTHDEIAFGFTIQITH